MLQASDLALRPAGRRPLLDGCTFSLLGGERVALVGENGVGKSTLLGILMERVPRDEGQVRRQSGSTIGILTQEPDLDLTATVRQVAEEGLRADRELLAAHSALCDAMERGEDHSDALASLSLRIESRGAFSIDHRVDEVLERLSLPNQDAIVGSLSGGERRRLDLARLLLERPDIILLDEPTNHLDESGIRFLGETLRAHEGACLFVTHDRIFLDAVATRLLELDDGQLHGHPPPWAAFVERRVTRQALEGRTAARRERLWERELAWLRAGVKARTTKSKSRIERAHEIHAQVRDDAEKGRVRRVDVKAAPTSRLGNTVVEMRDLALGYTSRPLFRGLDLTVVAGERWGILGPNGAGKSSLLTAILGQLKPQHGTLRLGSNTKPALLDQHRAALHGATPLETLLCPDGGDMVILGDERIHICSYLERFLFQPDDRRRPASTLSGGERNRLHLARFLLGGANCILLDEPTNDLDVATLGVLEETLLNHNGAALIVSHDQAFLDRVATGILTFEPAPPGDAAPHVVVAVQGGIEDVMRVRAGRANAAAPTKRPAETPKEIVSVSPPKAPGEAKARKRSFAEQREYESIEALIAEKEAARGAAMTALEDPTLYKSRPEEAATLTSTAAALEAEIEKLYARWQALEGLRASN